MIKHKGMPGRFPGTDFQFTIRRAADKPTPIITRERYADRKKSDLEVDAFFLASLIDLFGDQPFERGNLDAGRLSWLFGREVLAAETPFDPASYDALLRVDLAAAAKSFPEALS
ncbi:MAG: hypothetical protein AAF360_17080 [Pseudomonadota bacterium]